MLREKLSAIVTVAVVSAFTSIGQAAVMPDTLGDTTPEKVYGANASDRLTKLLQNAGITRPNGTAINVGDVSAGQDPATSDQLQYQVFNVTTAPAQVDITYYGGSAAYKNIIGIYTAPLSDPTNRTLTPAFTANVDPIHTTFSHLVQADHLFGFYIDTNGAVSSNGLFYTENSLNSDNKHGVVTDHFLFFESNKGLAVAVEDLRYDKDTKKLGDQDYNDVIFTVKYQTIPEPASLALLSLGALALLPRRRRNA